MQSKRYLQTDRPYGGLDLVISPTGTPGHIIDPFVKKLGQYALYNRTDITGLSFASLETMSDYALYSTRGLKWVSFPNLQSVTGSNVMRYAAVSKLSFPRLKNVSDYAFDNLTNLTEFHAPLLENVGTYFLSGCTNLRSVDLPLLRIIGAGAFSDCTKLATLNLPAIEELDLQCSDYGLSISANAFPNLRVLSGSYLYGHNSVSSVDWPNIEAINAYGTFISCYSLKTVSMPNVSILGSCTFFADNSLSSIYAPKLRIISNSCFSDCYSLNINFSQDMSRLESVGNYAFYSCSNIDNFYGKNVKYIGENAFGYCSKLSGIIDLPVCSGLANYAFANTSINGVILGGSSITMGSYPFNGCSRFSYLEFTNVTSLALNSSFWNRLSSSLMTLSAPKLNYMNENYVYWSSFTKLTNLNTPNLYGIPSYYYGSTRYSSSTIDMPYVKQIGSYAFASNSYLVEATFGSKWVEKANDNSDSNVNLYNNYYDQVLPGAFLNCSNLEKLTLYTTSLYSDALVGCSKLSVLNLPRITRFESSMLSDLSSSVSVTFGSISYYGASLVNNPIINAMSSLYAPYCMSVENYAFRSCSNLISADFGRSVAGCSISASAFADCLNLETVICNPYYIGMYAFSGCSKLTSFVADRNEASAYTIYSYAFMNCTALESVRMTGKVSFYSTYIFSNCTALKTLDLPHFSFGGFGYSYAFSGGCNIENLYLGSNTSFFWQYSFGLSRLQVVSMPRCVSFSTSANWLGKVATLKEFTCAGSEIGGTWFSTGFFSGNSGIQKINGVITSPNPYVCYNCSNLTTVGAVSGSVYSNAFYNCQKLESINVSNVVLISTSAFMNCYALPSVNLPRASTIGANAFANCSTLSTVFAPVANEVNGFANCSSLHTVVINYANTNTISAFTNDVALMSLYLIGNCLSYSGTAAVVRLPIANAFSNTPIVNSELTGDFGSIYVKASFLDSYKAHASWASYADRIVGLTDSEITEVLSIFS